MSIRALVKTARIDPPLTDLGAVSPSGNGERLGAMLRSVIYTSSAAPGFDSCALDDILSVSRRNNARWHLTGVLLYESGTFLQVVEGPDWPMQKTLERIGRDERHGRMEVLADMRTDRRYFPDWAMGSRELDGEGAFSLSEDEMNARLSGDVPAVIRVMIRTFFRVNARYGAWAAA